MSDFVWFCALAGWTSFCVWLLWEPAEIVGEKVGQWLSSLIFGEDY